MKRHDKGDIALSPNAWLKEMARINPAHWDISRCCRAALAVGFPMMLGYLTNTLMYTMWISMGALFPSIGERDAPYSVTLKKIIVSVPIGAAGFLLGYLNTWGLDWAWIVLVMSVLGFLVAIASSYSSAISVGSMQFMVMGAVALGNPEIGTFWKQALLLIGGGVFYVLLVLLEKLIRPHHLRRDAIVETLQALTAICQAKVDQRDPEEARLQYTIKYEALYSFMLQTRFRALGHNAMLDQTANVVQDLDSLFAAVMAEQDLDQLQRLQACLQQITGAVQRDETLPCVDPGGLTRWKDVNDLMVALWGTASATPQRNAQPADGVHLRLLLEKLTPGRTTVHTAAKLMLCTALGYSVHWAYQASHWYWVPMTVAIVMKPELGSIFVRAVQRAAGTAVGVLIGGLLLAFLPVGPVFILIIAAITFLLPWLSQRNYALTALAITPLVLVMIDFLSPERQGVDYAALRLVDTLLGCAIVLIFGYLIWPRRHFSELTQSMNKARRGIADYLKLVLAHRLNPESTPLVEARRSAYSNLVDMRSTLQKSMAEPPPAGMEAAAWFPLVVCAARLCDAITAYSGCASAQPDPQEWAWLQQMPQAIEGLEHLPALPDDALARDTPEAHLIASIHKEAEMRERLYERTTRSAH